MKKSLALLRKQRKKYFDEVKRLKGAKKLSIELGVASKVLRELDRRMNESKKMYEDFNSCVKLVEKNK
jgi:hypothetical protein